MYFRFDLDMVCGVGAVLAVMKRVLVVRKNRRIVIWSFTV